MVIQPPGEIFGIFDPPTQLKIFHPQSRCQMKITLASRLKIRVLMWDQLGGWVGSMSPAKNTDERVHFNNLLALDLYFFV